MKSGIDRGREQELAANLKQAQTAFRLAMVSLVFALVVFVVNILSLVANW